MALGRQPVTRRWEQRRGYVKVSTVRLQGVPLGQRQEGRVWEDLPESERCGCRKGAEIDREEDGERRRRCGVSCYLPLKFCRTP